MSLRSLYRAGLAETARGVLTHFFQGRTLPLTESMIDKVYQAVADRVQTLSRADKRNLRTLVYEQERSVRAGLAVNNRGWVDGRGVPLTGRDVSDFRGTRFRVVYRIDLVDVRAGTREAQIGIFRTDERVDLQRIIEALQQDEGPAVLTWQSHTIVRPGKEYDWTSLRVLGVERIG